MKIALLPLLVLLAGCATKTASLSEPMTEQASATYDLAYDYYIQGDMVRALGAATQAVELSPNNPYTRNLLGLIYFRQQDYVTAETELKKAIELDSSATEAFNNLGTLYYETKRYDEAREMLLRAMSNPLYLYPERLYSNLGLVEMATGHPDKAASHFEKSISLNKDYFLPHQLLGAYYKAKGDIANSIKYLQTAVRLCQDCSEAHYQLGQALVVDRQWLRAAEVFQSGYRADPEGYYGLLCKESLNKNIKKP